MASSATHVVPYSLVSPRMLDTIGQHYVNEGGTSQSQKAILACHHHGTEAVKGIAPFKTCIGETVLASVPPRLMAKEKGSLSPIQIWDARNPDKAVLMISSEPYKDRGRAHQNFEVLRATDVFFREVYRRAPVANETTLIRSFYNHPQVYNNACWYSETQSVYYGECDPRVFTSFVDNQEITTHELGHAVTDLSSGLVYRDQSGALNESVSDVFAIQHKHRLRSSDNPARPDVSWWIGEGMIVQAGGTNQSLRSMSAPGTAYDHPIAGRDPQVGHMSEYQALPESEDNGGVHINSGIPNRAFHLAAVKFQRPTWEDLGQVWYRALLDSDPNETFSSFANRTITIAKSMSPELEDCVAKAWSEVGIDLRGKKVARETAGPSSPHRAIRQLAPAPDNGWSDNWLPLILGVSAGVSIVALIAFRLGRR